MYLDALLLVSDAQALAATGVSTNAIDLGDVTPKREVGTGEPIGFGVSIDVAADFTTGDETYQVNLISDDAAALSSPTVISSHIFTAAERAAGSLIFVPFPPAAPKERYIGLQYVLGGTTPSVTVTAWFTTRSLFSVAVKAYAKGYAV